MAAGFEIDGDAEGVGGGPDLLRRLERVGGVVAPQRLDGGAARVGSGSFQTAT